MDDFVGQFIRIFSQSPPSFGDADILAADSSHSAKRASAFAFVMSIAGTEDQKPLIRRVVVVAPPPTATSSVSHDLVLGGIANLAERRFGRSLDESELAAVRRHVTVVHAEDFTITSALLALRNAKEHDAAIIICAAIYRSTPNQLQPRPSSSFILEEEQWVSHVVQLAQQATAYASVVRHADQRLFRAARARLTFSRMSDALAVQTKGLGR